VVNPITKQQLGKYKHIFWFLLIVFIGGSGSPAYLMYCAGQRVNLAFQNPEKYLGPDLVNQSIALHSDIWAIMLFVASFVLYMLIATLYTAPSKSYKVHHHSLIEIVWTTVPALILYVITVFAFIVDFDTSDQMLGLNLKNNWSHHFDNSDYCCDTLPENRVLGLSKAVYNLNESSCPLPLSLETEKTSLSDLAAQCDKLDQETKSGSLTPRSRQYAQGRADQCRQSLKDFATFFQTIRQQLKSHANVGGSTPCIIYEPAV
jgi:Cytochrome C oxidase subunit II, transmembrane domain